MGEYLLFTEPGMQRISLLLLLVVIASSEYAGTARVVAVTFDDLPDINAGDDSVSQQEAITARLIASLRRNKVPAIGFVNEENLVDESGRPDPRLVALIEAWLDAGFEIGNHTFSHLDLSGAGPERFEADIVRGEVLTRPIIERRGLALRWFRHPFLDTGTTLADRDRVNAFLMDRGYRVAPVTVDNSDWIYHLAYLRAHRIQRPLIRRSYVRYMRDRFAYAESRSRLVFGREIPQVLLLHAGALNADAFDALAAMMRARGYEFVKIDLAAVDQAYISRDDWTGGGVSWLARWGVARAIPEERFEDDPKVPAWILRIARTKDQ